MLYTSLPLTFNTYNKLMFCKSRNPRNFKQESDRTYHRCHGKSQYGNTYQYIPNK